MGWFGDQALDVDELEGVGSGRQGVPSMSVAVDKHGRGRIECISATAAKLHRSILHNSARWSGPGGRIVEQ